MIRKIADILVFIIVIACLAIAIQNNIQIERHRFYGAILFTRLAQQDNDLLEMAIENANKIKEIRKVYY